MNWTPRIVLLLLLLALLSSPISMEEAQAAPPPPETPVPTLYFDLVLLTKQVVTQGKGEGKFTDRLLPEFEEVKGILGKQEEKLHTLIDTEILPPLRDLDRALATKGAERKRILTSVTDRFDRTILELMQEVRFFDHLAGLANYRAVGRLPKPTFKDTIQRLLRMSSYAPRQEACKSAVLDITYAHFRDNTRRGMIAGYLQILTHFLRQNAAAIDGRLTLAARGNLIDAIEATLQQEERWISGAVKRTQQELDTRCHVTMGGTAIEQYARLFSPTKDRLLQLLEVVPLLPASSG